MIDRKGDLLGKVLILGNSQVGKSSILNQFTEGSFSESMPPTLGIDYKISQITVGDETIKLQIWDTAGQEKFKSITENFYKGAQGIILVFDLTDRDSFSNIRTWLKNVFEKAGKNVVICLVGNKLDLLDMYTRDKDKYHDELEKSVRQEEVDQLLTEHSFHYLKASAKKNVNIKEAFNFIAAELLKKNEDVVKEYRGKNLKAKDADKKDETKTGGCC